MLNRGTSLSINFASRILEFSFLSHRVLSDIGSTKSPLSNLRSFTNEHLVVRYPVLEDQPQTPEARPPTSRRSLSIANDSCFRADVVVSPRGGGLVRSITLPNALEKEKDIADETMEPSSSDPIDFSLFWLDLKLGTHSSSPVYWSLSSKNHRSPS